MFLWITATHLIIFEQLFLSIRFLPNTTVLCRLFDNDFEIPTIFTFALISAATFRKMHFQIRTNLASIQITSETIHRQIQNDEKRNFLLSKLISELLNPIQNLHFTIEKNSGDIPEGLLLQLELFHLHEFLIYIPFLLLCSKYIHFLLQKKHLLRKIHHKIQQGSFP